MEAILFGFSVVAALAYGLMKCFFTYRWWFDGPSFWVEAFRPLPGDDYGSLLGAKWIGTRNLGLGVLVLACLGFRRYELLALLTTMGVIVEFFDGFWLAYGKFAAGWSRDKTNFYMIGAFVWVPVLAVATLVFAGRAA